MAKNSLKLATLDLHGRNTAEVFDAIEQFLARNANTPRVRIMPGKGSGKIKDQVIDYLKKARYPFEFEKLSDGRLNEGVLIVFLD